MPTRVEMGQLSGSEKVFVPCAVIGTYSNQNAYSTMHARR